MAPLIILLLQLTLGYGNLLEGLLSSHWSTSGNITSQSVALDQGGSLCPLKNSVYWTCSLEPPSLRKPTRKCVLQYDPINVTIHPGSVFEFGGSFQAATEEFPDYQLAEASITVKLVDHKLGTVFTWNPLLTLHSYSEADPRKQTITPVGIQYRTFKPITIPSWLVPNASNTSGIYTMNFSISVYTDNSQVVFSGEDLSLKIVNETANTTKTLFSRNCFTEDYTVALTVHETYKQGFIQQGQTWNLPLMKPSTPMKISSSDHVLGSLFYVLQNSSNTTGMQVIVYHIVTDHGRVLAHLNFTVGSQASYIFQIDARTSLIYDYKVAQISPHITPPSVPTTPSSPPHPTPRAPPPNSPPQSVLPPHFSPEVNPHHLYLVIGVPVGAAIAALMIVVLMIMLVKAKCDKGAADPGYYQDNGPVYDKLGEVTVDTDDFGPVHLGK